MYYGSMTQKGKIGIPDSLKEIQDIVKTWEIAELSMLPAYFAILFVIPRKPKLPNWFSNFPKSHTDS